MSNGSPLDVCSGTLEQLIDQHGPGLVLEAFTEVCHAKASHVLENWQDENLSSAWTEVGKDIDMAHSTVIDWDL